MDNNADVVPSDQELFAQFQQNVVQVNNGITTDAQEWATLATICGKGWTIADYASAASEQLWTDGEDQGSWTIVKDAATKAASQPEYPALLTVMQGFASITDPSHNSSAWSDLAQQAGYVMANAGKNPPLGPITEAAADGVSAAIGSLNGRNGEERRPSAFNWELSCCRFRGHRDKVFLELEDGDVTTEVQPRVQARGGEAGARAGRVGFAGRPRSGPARERPTQVGARAAG